MTPALSVILPVHNGMLYVEESIRSILAQSIADFELVIGDDGSNDGTTPLLVRLAAEDRRIRLLRRERPSGLAGSANWVVSETRAPFVAVAHADDTSKPARLARQIEILRKRSEVDLVGTLWDGIDEDGRIVRPADFWRLLRPSPFAPFSHSSIMFRRDAFNAIGGYRTQAEYWEDLDLYYRIAASGRIVVIPEPLSSVRHARTSTRLRDQQEQVESAVDLMFRSTVEYAAGRDHTLLAPAANHEKLNPATFISCGSTRLWSGRSPAMIGRMRERGMLRFNSASAYALAWVLWGSMSPKTLRFFLRTVLHTRNLLVNSLLRSKELVEWSPRPRTADLTGLENCQPQRTARLR